MSLTLDVFNSGYVPVNGGPGWESARAATWPASTATLIAGERGAILVDALMTIEEGRQLASWIGDSGKNLTNIVITHGHGDHFFGAGPVLAAFPEARLVALNTAVVDEARMHVVDPILQNWIEWFRDEFNHQAAVPQALGSETLTVEEHPVHLIDVGGADGADGDRAGTSPNWTPFAPATRSTTTSTCGCGTRHRRAATPGCRPSTRLPT